LKANTREEHERELSSLKKQLEIGEKQNRESKMAKKYQMVRFFGISLTKSSNSRTTESHKKVAPG
jgi:hypothetical protein